MSERIEKVNSLIKKELGQVLIRDIEIGDNLITITGIDTSPDLAQAKVWISVLGNEKETLNLLKENIYQIQGELNKRIKTKRVPRIIFAIDKGGERVSRISQLLDQGL